VDYQWDKIAMKRMTHVLPWHWEFQKINFQIASMEIINAGRTFGTMYLKMTTLIKKEIMP